MEWLKCTPVSSIGRVLTPTPQALLLLVLLCLELIDLLRQFLDHQDDLLIGYIIRLLTHGTTASSFTRCKLKLNPRNRHHLRAQIGLQFENGGNCCIQICRRFLCLLFDSKRYVGILYLGEVQ